MARRSRIGYLAQSESGFTLIEAMVALAVFVGIVVPIVSLAFRNSQTTRAGDLLTAACIIEQESALLRACPQTWVPSKQRTVRGMTWIVTSEATGDVLKQFRVSVSCKGWVIGSAYFAVYAGAP